jgi:hypothetical protein
MDLHPAGRCLAVRSCRLLGDGTLEAHQHWQELSTACVSAGCRGVASDGSSMACPPAASHCPHHLPPNLFWAALTLVALDKILPHPKPIGGWRLHCVGYTGLPRGGMLPEPALRYSLSSEWGHSTFLH